MRAFVQLRHMIVTNSAMAEKLQELERKVAGHDEAIRSLVRAIRQLMAPPEKARRSIASLPREARAQQSMMPAAPLPSLSSLLSC